MSRECNFQLGLWPDATFDGNRTRNYRRSPRQARADYYRTYLGTVQWQCRRGEVIERGEFICAMCGKPGRLQVHHLSYKRVGDEHVGEDLRALCRRCHERVTELEYDKRGC